MIKNKKKIPLVDLFSGSGGLSLGLQQAGFDIRAAVEINESAIQSYTNWFGDIVLKQDIATITGEELLKKAGIRKNQSFVLAGCPPCQGFSSIGTRDEKDIRNQLVFHYIRLVKETKPRYILMENVPGMSRGIGKTIFKKACKLLSEDYIIHYDVLNSADYGVAQTRKRLVLHGVRKDIYSKYLRHRDIELLMPNPTHINPQKRKNDELLPWNTVSVIRHYPSIEGGCDDKSFLNHRSRKLDDINLERIRYIRENGGNRTCLPERLVLECHKNHNGHKDVYGVLSWDKPAPTITAGCLSYSKGRFGHPNQDRAISVREAACLQSFPDDFEFFGSLEDMGRQVGNAVPPLLAEASGKYILELMAKERYNRK